jgi:hypothetical protein
LSRNADHGDDEVFAGTVLNFRQAHRIDAETVVVVTRAGRFVISFSPAAFRLERHRAGARCVPCAVSSSGRSSRPQPMLAHLSPLRASIDAACKNCPPAWP